MPVHRLRIAKQFYSLQGEGDLSGVPMWFVRTAGCSAAQCPLHPSKSGLCDTDWKFRETISVEEIARQAKQSGAHWVCVTGGEPTDQLPAITELAARVHQNNQRIMLQTSGIREVPDCWDWLVVSPKVHFTKLAQTSGHELKAIWSGEDYGHLRAMATQTQFLRYYLQPLCQPDGSTNVADVARVVMRCGEIGIPFRLGIQQHKLWSGE